MKVIPRYDRLHEDDYIEWTCRAWLVDRLQTRLDIRPVIELFLRLDSLQIKDPDPEQVEQSLFEWLMLLAISEATKGNNAGAIGARLLYRWCLDEDLPGFNEFRLHELDRVPLASGDAQHLVSMRDVREGPFTRIELDRIELELRSTAGVTLRQRALYHLGRDWGLRPIQMALLRPQDFDRDSLGPFIMVPSVKGIRRSRLRRAAGNFVKRYIADDTAEALEKQIQAAESEATYVWTRYYAIHKDLVGTEPQRVTPIFPSLARTDDRLLRFCKNPPLAEYVLHADSLQLSREIRRLSGQLRIINTRANRQNGSEEIMEISAYRLRRTKGTSMVLSGATPEEVAAALDHESVATIAHYFRYNAELHEFINQIHASSPEISEAVRLWSGRFQEDSQESNFNIPIGKLGKCTLGKPCPHHPMVTCYACHNFRPSRTADHKAALDDIQMFQREVAKRSTGPIQQQLEAAIWGAKAVIKAIEIEDSGA